MEVLQFDIKGDFAHFRKPYSNISRLTYRVPPRMTMAGLLAGVLGLERDSYYDIFSSDTFKMSVEAKKQLETTRIPQNVVGTAEENMIKVNSRGSEPVLKLIDSSDARKQRVFEYVVNPEYRVYIKLSDDEIQEELYNALSESTYKYTPSLGLAKCIANISNVKLVSTSPVEEGRVQVFSPVTDSMSVQNVNNSTIVTEKITESFEMAKGSRGLPRRKSTGFTQYVFETTGDGLQVDAEEHDGELVRVDDSVVELY